MAELMARQTSAVNTIKKGDVVEGVIKKLTAKEILMDIGAKSDALVIEYDKTNLDNLLRLLKEGETVKAVVISAEAEEGFPVVSLRRTLDDIIFARFDSLYKENESFKVQIVEATRGGYFAQAPSGVRGFLPNSQILQETDLVGQHIDVKIIELDRAKKRVIFSQKATLFTTDPALLEKHVKKGTSVEAKVSGVTPYGLYVTITPTPDVFIEGFIHISEVSYDRIANLADLYKKDQSITAQVLDVDRENRRVNLSIKNLTSDEFTTVKEKYKAEQKIKGTVTDVKSRGVTLEVEPGVNAFIPSSKIPTDTTYAVGDSLNLEVSDFDQKRRVILVTPVLKKTFVGYR